MTASTTVYAKTIRLSSLKLITLLNQECDKGTVLLSHYVYSVRFRDNKTVATSVASPATSKVLHKFDIATTDNINQIPSNVNSDLSNGDKGTVLLSHV